MKACVLLSTYNGEQFLREQLDSLIAQKLPEDCELLILVRDDGSSDSTIQILEEYKEKCSLQWYKGENLKSAKSFWDLVKNSPDSDYYCFCDQDDVWFSDKVDRAIKMLQEQENQDQPLLYCSNVTVVDRDLNPIAALNKGEYRTDFASALIFSIAPGCTMVFNKAAKCALMKYDMNKEYVVIHDWLAHKIVAMLGRVIYDDIPSLSYRQHGNNVIGAPRGGKIGAFFSKVKRMFGNHALIRSEVAKSLINVYGSQLDSEKLHLLDIVANYRTNRSLKKEFLKSRQFADKKRRYLKWLIRLNKI